MLPDLGRLSLLPAAGARTGVPGRVDLIMSKPLQNQAPKPQLNRLADKSNSLREVARNLYDQVKALLFPEEGDDWNKELSREMVQHASGIATSAEEAAISAESVAASVAAMGVVDLNERLQAAAGTARGYAKDAMSLVERATEELNEREWGGLVNTRGGLYSFIGVKTPSQEKCSPGGRPPNAGVRDSEWSINEEDDGAKYNKEGKLHNPNGELSALTKVKLITEEEIVEYTDDQARLFDAKVVKGATRRETKEALDAAALRYRQTRAWLPKFGRWAAAPVQMGMWLQESEIASIDERLRFACVQWARWELRHTTDDALYTKGNPTIWAALLVLQALAERNASGRVEISKNISYLEYNASSFYTLEGLLEYMKGFQSEEYYDEAYQDASRTLVPRRFYEVVRNNVHKPTPHKLAWFAAGDDHARNVKVKFLDHLLRRDAAARAVDELGEDADPDQVKRVSRKALEDPKSGLAKSVLNLEGPLLLEGSTVAPVADAPAALSRRGKRAAPLPPTPDPPLPAPVSPEENERLEKIDNVEIARLQKVSEKHKADDVLGDKRLVRLKSKTTEERDEPQTREAEAGATAHLAARPQLPPEPRQQSTKSASKPAPGTGPRSRSRNEEASKVSKATPWGGDVPEAHGIQREIMLHNLTNSGKGPE